MRVISAVYHWAMKAGDWVADRYELQVDLAITMLVFAVLGLAILAGPAFTLMLGLHLISGGVIAWSFPTFAGCFLVVAVLAWLS